MSNLIGRQRNAGSKTIAALVEQIARGCVAAGVITEANISEAHRIVCAEAAAFIAGDAYKDERACLMAGTVSAETVMASVVASCILKIKSNG